LLMGGDRGQAEIGVDVLKYNIGPGQALLLLPGSILTLHRTSGRFGSRYLYMSDRVFKEATYKVDRDFFMFIKGSPVIGLDMGTLGFVDKWFSLARHVIDGDNHRFREEIIGNLLQCLFLESNHRMEGFFGRNKTKSNRQEELFRQFMVMVKQQCRRFCEVEYYADQLCISPWYLSFICSNSANNLPPKKIIDLQAILEIKIMLETTGEPLQKIAERMNFPDQSYFGRFFKRYSGQSPLSYRLRKKVGNRAR
ncbi:MAG: helix-turn-helix transcriptional regulator, partial [Alistipes sp.]|nr:helix-turn-helix transcriptional regulator [Alistipes sp.]